MPVANQTDVISVANVNANKIELRGAFAVEALALVNDHTNKSAILTCAQIHPGAGAPSGTLGGKVTSPTALYIRTDGTTDTTLYVTVDTGTTWTPYNNGAIAVLSDGTVSVTAASGSISETGLVNLTLTPTGTLELRGGGVSTFGDDTGYLSFNGTGALTTTGVTSITHDPGIGGDLTLISVDSGVVALNTGGASTTVTLNIPSGAKLLAANVNVTTAIAGVSASGVTINAAFSGGSTMNIGDLVAAGDGNLPVNTKINKILDPNVSGIITSGTTNVAILISGGADNNPSAGAVRVQVWYQTLAALDNV